MQILPTLPNPTIKNFKVSLGLVITILSISDNALDQQRLVKLHVCNDPAGRVLSTGDLKFLPGSQFCQGDKIQPGNGATVEIMCYSNQKILKLKHGKVYSTTNICTLPQEKVERVCTPQTPSSCLRMKNPNERQDVPTVITPYRVGQILNGRPLISWLPVSWATSYTVVVEGKGVQWSSQVKGNKLSYPKEQPAMQLGHMYKIDVIANKSDEPIVSAPAVLIVVPEEEAQKLTDVIKRIKSFNLSKDDLAIDLHTAYMSKDLLTEAIDILKARIQERTQNPTVYRLLGDRYRQVGLLEESNHSYRMAVQYAKLNNNPNELEKAKAGLKILQQI